MSIEEIINRLGECGISVYEYKENDKICGYELNTYTDCSVNQIIFVDFRDTDKDPTNGDDFIDLYNERVNSIDIDDEIETNRQDKSYREDFTLTVALQDFKDWKENLQNIFGEVKR
jgi:hypothetical protein